MDFWGNPLNIHGRPHKMHKVQREIESFCNAHIERHLER